MGEACVKKDRPADFDPYLSNAEAKERWGCGIHTLLRWRSEVGVDRRKMLRWSKDDAKFLADNVHHMTWQQLADHLGRSRDSVMEAARRRGLCRSHASGQQVNPAGFVSDSAPRYFMVSARSMGIQDLAADFIRAHDRTCVFRCKKSGEYDKDGKYWKYGRGSLVLTPQEMMDKAERKGWVYSA